MDWLTYIKGWIDGMYIYIYCFIFFILLNYWLACWVLASRRQWSRFKWFFDCPWNMGMEPAKCYLDAWGFGAIVLRKFQLRLSSKLRSLFAEGLGGVFVLSFTLSSIHLWSVMVSLGCPWLFKHVQTCSGGKFLWICTISCTGCKLSTTRKPRLETEKEDDFYNWGLFHAPRSILELQWRGSWQQQQQSTSGRGWTLIDKVQMQTWITKHQSQTMNMNKTYNKTHLQVSLLTMRNEPSDQQIN